MKVYDIVNVLRISNKNNNKLKDFLCADSTDYEKQSRVSFKVVAHLRVLAVPVILQCKFS